MYTSVQPAHDDKRRITIFLSNLLFVRVFLTSVVNKKAEYLVVPKVGVGRVTGNRGVSRPHPLKVKIECEGHETGVVGTGALNGKR